MSMPKWIVPGVATLLSLIAAALVAGADANDTVPLSVAELWADFDPRRNPLETEVIREWREGGGVFRHVRFLVGTFKGKPARMAAIYGFPEHAEGKVPAVMHIHGGGQRGSLDEVKFLVGRGYAGLSVNWGGRGGSDGPFNSVQGAEPGDPNTDWGAVDPSQCNVQGYSTMLPGPLQFYDDQEHPKNNNWYLLALGCRRGLTFLEQQPEVDPARLGVHGYSMGGNLTMYVAGTDDRVKAAVPGVGGQGWRWEPHVFSSGTVRPQDSIKGDVEVFRRTLSFENYAPHIRCPVLHRSATNDFHGWMDDVYRTNALIPGQPVRYSWTPHFNHRLSPEVAVAMPLWLDHFLKGGPALPETPDAGLELKTSDGVPQLRVRADGRWPAERCEIFYSVDPDPRARFWRSADVTREGDVFTASLPLESVDRPLFAFANVYHAIPEPVSMKALPGNGNLVRELCLSSELRAASPADLATAGVQSSPVGGRVIDDFAHGWRDWYRMNVGNPVHWQHWTRKVTDPAWRGPDGAALAITLTMPKTNWIAIVVVENEWRGERGRRRTYTCSREVPGAAAPQTLVLRPGDFTDKDGPLASWAEVDVLGICGVYGEGQPKREASWDGPLPEFERIEWRETAAAIPPAGHEAGSFVAEGAQALAIAAAQSGDPVRGAVIFHMPHLTCTKCHVAGEGVSPLGPNLAGQRLGSEGPLTGAALTEHLVESLLEPSKTMRPEYRAVTILTTEGQAVSGLVARETADLIVLRDAAAGGKEVDIARSDIDERTDLPTSLMPAGLVNLLADRQQFLDLVSYLDEIARGGVARAEALRPDPALLAPAGPAEYETTIDHAAFLADWSDPAKAAEAFKRGEAIYGRVCANCHGTHAAPGSLPTALRFAEGKFKAGADPHAMYRTLTTGTGQMVAQSWMVPSQKYDVIHYIREAYLKDRNSSSYTSITPDYLAGLPKGASRGPEPSTIEPWRIHDYGPFLAASIEVGNDGTNVARKGLAVRLDPGPGGIGRGHAWILYELDTLRVAAIWTGDEFIDWRGINFDGSHGTHPHVVGQVVAATPTLPGWADPAGGSFADPRPRGRDDKPYGPLPRSHAAFTALHHAGDHVVLDYTVGQTQILETARLEPGTGAASRGARPIVTRIWTIAPHDSALAVRVAPVGSGRSPTAAALLASPTPTARLEVRDGLHTLVLPPSTAPVTVAVAVAAGDQQQLETAVARQSPPESLAAIVGVPARNPWAAPLETRVVRGGDTGPFATDMFTPPSVNPWNAQVRFSGIDFVSDDEAVLCTWDGDVWAVRGITAADGKLIWKRVASGLYQPLGIKVIGGETYVGCRDRIAILRDLDGDGCTDRYDSFNSDHQVTEHFHEFAMGLETDAAGDLYYAKSARHALPAVVPHHGTLLKVVKSGSATEIVATGFRAANGVCVEPDGTFFVTDQEGHWCPKNRINHVRRGGFYGNMFGHHDVTDPGDAAMEQPLAWLTNAFDRSPAELLRVPGGAWPPLSGGLLELSYGEGRIHLVLPQQIAGAPAGAPPRLQGGLVALPMPDLPTGIMRGRFHPGDHALYTCGLFAWAGNKTAPGGFFRVRRTRAPLCMPVELAATAEGFTVVFSAPLDRVKATDAAAWTCRVWRLERSANYGSKHIGEHGLKVAGVDVSSDGRTATVRIEGFAATPCYEFTWNIQAADGTPVRGRIDGTVHAVP